MLTVVIATHESERSLVQTLAPLVSGATAGLITEVIVADAGSTRRHGRSRRHRRLPLPGADAAAGRG